MKPLKISSPNLNHKVFIAKESNVEMLVGVGVASLPPSLIPTLQNKGLLQQKQAKLRILLQHSVGAIDFHLVENYNHLCQNCESSSTHTYRISKGIRIGNHSQNQNQRFTVFLSKADKMKLAGLCAEHCRESHPFQNV